MKIGTLIAKQSVGFVEEATAYLEKLPDDEVLTIGELAEALGRNPVTNAYQRRLTGYCIKILLDGKHKWAYGNPRAIKALKKKLATKFA